ncbi:hypothetical protein PPERSA_02158 [Pseudocohnilembus persalinus]|uniref:Uncharacterized protein n=1 Tax=Pseudocohnilembus persalinus TaxID=266149 RepID=A0A0V0Q809_PSEPJ|nr:hypothetical protein PPERSA_02158 [Pseudocohnilembus persalinus]|eukprot:KRW98180.1 hypothetical protein PPERSA_02158 [Pseudocohnilembus persalinus]
MKDNEFSYNNQKKKSNFLPQIEQKSLIKQPNQGQKQKIVKNIRQNPISYNENYEVLKKYQSLMSKQSNHISFLKDNQNKNQINNKISTIKEEKERKNHLESLQQKVFNQNSKAKNEIKQINEVSNKQNVNNQFQQSRQININNSPTYEDTNTMIQLQQNQLMIAQLQQQIHSMQASIQQGQQKQNSMYQYQNPLQFQHIQQQNYEQIKNLQQLNNQVIIDNKNKQIQNVFPNQQINNPFLGQQQQYFQQQNVFLPNLNIQQLQNPQTADISNLMQNNQQHNSSNHSILQKSHFSNKFKKYDGMTHQELREAQKREQELIKKKKKEMSNKNYYDLDINYQNYKNEFQM